MKKRIYASIILLIFFCMSSALSRDILPEVESPSGLKVDNNKGEIAGTVKKRKDILVFYDKDAVTFKKYGHDEWRIYNMDDKYVAKLVLTNDTFKLYDKSGRFTGFIIYVKRRESSGNTSSSKHIEPRLTDQFTYQSTVTGSDRISPQASQLYLYVMKAFE